VEAINGKKFSKSYYSQGLWSEEMIRMFLQDQSEGKTSDFMKQISLAFKAYLETGITHNDYREKILKLEKY